MKNKLIITLVILVVIALVILGFVSFKGTKKVSSKTEGSTLTFSLDSNSSTGYNWKEKVDKKGIIDVSYKYDNSGCPPDVVGCGGKRVYTVKALKPGKVKLTLTYSFGDGKNLKEKETAIYEIIVTDDLKISESHSGSYFDKHNK